MSNPSCLILVDLQNEFLAPEGAFPVADASRPFLDNIKRLVALFRASTQPIIWVRSIYHRNRGSSDSTAPPNFLSGTHTGRKPCCAQGTSGAEFYSDFLPLTKNGIVITKNWYSAFKDTPLLDELKRLDVTRIVLVGLLTNVCINATAIDASDLALDVTIVSDCLGWRNRDSHDKALESMRHNLGVSIVSLQSFAREPQEQSDAVLMPPKEISAPKLYYVNGSIPSWRVFMALYEKDVAFEPVRVKVMSDPKETRLPEFLAMNHRGKTPVFVDLPSSSLPSGSQTPLYINESLAVIQYIETYYSPSIPLLPPIMDRAARALVLSRVQETENLHNIYDAFEEAYYEAQHADIQMTASSRAPYIAHICHELDYWETYARTSKYIASDQFTLADCAFYPIMAYMVHRGFDWRKPYKDNTTQGDGTGSWPWLRAYFQRVWDRGGETGPAQRSQPEGWSKRGKANVWAGTRGGARGLYVSQRRKVARLFENGLEQP